MTTRQQEWQQRVQAMVGRDYGRVFAWDAINAPMVRHWCEALGNKNPVYTDSDFAKSSIHGGLVAPPTMLQAWLFPGYEGKYPPGSAGQGLDAIMELLAEEGFTTALGVNSDQEYRRYLRPGDHLYAISTIDAVSEQKRTAVGDGYFVTVLTNFFDQNDLIVASMTYRQLVYRPRNTAPAAGQVGVSG